MLIDIILFAFIAVVAVIVLIVIALLSGVAGSGAAQSVWNLWAGHVWPFADAIISVTWPLLVVLVVAGVVMRLMGRPHVTRTIAYFVAVAPILAAARLVARSIERRRGGATGPAADEASADSDMRAGR